MGRGTSRRLLTGSRVSELTGLHGVTLGKLVNEGFLERDHASLKYTGTELVVAQALAQLQTRASKAEAGRDRRVIQTIRDALTAGEITETTDLVVSGEFMQLTHTPGERLDATSALRDYRVLGVGAWVTEFKQREPEAFDVDALIAA
ncbi:hypothetical protein [Streptomyces sp. H036]|uniref:hypothetical protein n=1 Tax=Streptomyces sp. H036 TaxID=1519487 RepID=UPI0006AFC2E4|nr:hypothetical protein [Streptomyces sp. H036]KOV37234.1 hypothetical protein ADK98_37600 [Streptomyces sp. H036]